MGSQLGATERALIYKARAKDMRADRAAILPEQQASRAAQSSLPVVPAHSPSKTGVNALISGIPSFWRRLRAARRGWPGQVPAMTGERASATGRWPGTLM